jgi:hypothetical protein
MSITLPRANSGKPLTADDYNSGNLIVETAINDLQSATSSNGTVTSVSDVDTDVAELFTTAITNSTTTPQTTFTRSTKAANLVYASPNGSSGKGTFRSLTSTDFPTIPYTKGGTGLTSISANKVLRTNNAGTAYNLGEIKAGSNKLSVGLTDPDITLDVVPANIPIDGLNGSTPLSIVKGGSGQATAQLAINALTQVSSATNEYVLTKDTATGDATYKVLPNIVTGKITDNNVTYAKIQQVGASKLLGNPTGSTANTSEIGVGGNLFFSSTTLKQRQGVVTILSTSGTYQVLATEGNIYADATSGAITVKLPSISTISIGDIFTIKKLNSGTPNVTVSVYDAVNDALDGSASEAITGQYHSITVQYSGLVGGKNVWYIIGKVA